MTNEQERKDYLAMNPEYHKIAQRKKDIYRRAAMSEANSLAAKVPADPCLVLWQAMNEAEKVGNRTDDKLIVEFLHRAGYCIATAPAPEAERQALRYAQAEAVMPLIGPLLDAWESADRDVLAVEPELAKRLSQINKAMEGAEAEPCTYPACQTNGCREACESPAQAQQAKGDPKLLAILNAPMTLQEAYGEGWCDRKQFKNFDEAWQHSTTRYKAEAELEAQQAADDSNLAFVIGQRDWAFKQLAAKPEAQQPLGEAQLEAAYREIWRNKPAHFGFTTSDWITAGIRYAERAHGIGASGEASK